MFFHDTIRNMGEARACAYIFVTLLSSQLIVAKPFFGLGLWCGFLCDDYDSSEEYDYGLCDGCPKSPTQSPPTSPVLPPAQPGQMSVVIPPANGVNLTMSNTGGSWFLNLLPWSTSGTAPGATPAPAAGATPAPTAAATPAPAAGATPAPAAAATTAAATTAAAAATTAAATTAAAGK